MALTEKLTNIANAVRAKTGKTDKLTLEQIPIEIAAIETGGASSGDSLDEVLEGLQLNGNVVTGAKIIADYALPKQNNLITIKGDNCINVGVSAFEYSPSIISADFPNLRRISQYAFRSCENLKTVNAPNVTVLGGNAFSQCVSLEDAIFPMLTTLYGNNAVFSGCTNLKNIRFDKLTVIGGNEFTNCTSLETASFPSLNDSVFAQAFMGCTSLKKVDFGGMANFSRTQVFDGCTSLEAVILRSTTKVSVLSNVNNFANSGISNGTGFIYVPNALLEEYKVATNWSIYANQFKAIEGSEYE